MRCQSCQVENPDQNRFCGGCGSALSRTCAGCGNSNPPDHRFCGQCGQALVSNSAPTPSPAPVSSAPTAATDTDAGAERRQLTVMFCDLADSTRLSEILEPEDLREIIKQYQQICTQQIEAFGGYVARYMGDGILAYFGFPQAHEDDPVRGLHAGLGVINAIHATVPVHPVPLRVRLGIATGQVVAGDLIGTGAAEEHAVLGVTPNLAARLQGVAEPDSMVVSDATRRLAGGFFEFEDLGERTLKGIRRPERVWRVIGEAVVASRFEAATARGVTKLVGRDEEVSLLARHWRTAAGGEGEVVLLTGEAGVGKSRVLQGLRDRVALDAHGIISLSCSPFHAHSAFWPLIACLERVFGFERGDAQETKQEKLRGFIERLELPAAEIEPWIAWLVLDSATAAPVQAIGNAGERKRKLIEALLKMLFARTSQVPMLFIVEDVHWIDPSTAEFLASLIEQVERLAIMVVVCGRPEFDDSWIRHDHLTTLRLGRLGRDDCAAMVTHVTGERPLPPTILAQIIARTDGVPLYVEELTKAVVESGQLVERNGRFEIDGAAGTVVIPETLHDSLMARLDRLGSTKEVAQLASVIGRRFDERLLAGISRLAAPDLRAALKQLVDAGIVIRRGRGEAAYEFRHALVQDVAYASLLKNLRLRHHRVLARVLAASASSHPVEPEVLAHHYTEGGEASLARPQWRAAAARAMKHWAVADSAEHLRKALAGFAAAGEEEQGVDEELSVCAELASALRILDRYDEALAVLERAQGVAERFARTEDLARIHYSRGSVYFPMGNLEGCLQQHEIARDLAKSVASTELEIRALSGLGDANFMRGRMASAQARYDECVELCRQHALPEIEPANLAMRGHARLYMNRLSDALEDSLKAVDLAAAHGLRRDEMVARGGSAGKILFDMARFDEAHEQCSRSVELSKKLGARRFEPINQVVLARIAAVRGNTDEAARIAQCAVDTTRVTGARFAGAMALGALALVTPEASVRANALREGLSMLHAGCVGQNYLWFYRDAIDACIKAGDWTQARSLADAADAWFAAEPLPWMTLLIRRGRLLADLGERGESDESVRERQSVRDAAAQAGFQVLLASLERAPAQQR